MRRKYCVYPLFNNLNINNYFNHNVNIIYINYKLETYLFCHSFDLHDIKLKIKLIKVSKSVKTQIFRGFLFSLTELKTGKMCQMALLQNPQERLIIIQKKSLATFSIHFKNCSIPFHTITNTLEKSEFELTDFFQCFYILKFETINFDKQIKR